QMGNRRVALCTVTTSVFPLHAISIANTNARAYGSPAVTYDPVNDRVCRTQSSQAAAALGRGASATTTTRAATTRLISRPPLLRAQEGRELADLQRGQIDGVGVHDLVGSEVGRKDLQLLFEVAPVLARQAREGPVAAGRGRVAALARGNILRGDAVLVNLLSCRDLRGIGGGAASRRLRGEVGCDVLHRVVGQLGGHAPHVGLRMGIGPRMIAERAKLGLQIGRLLPG